jgi:hypothetical protein
VLAKDFASHGTKIFRNGISYPEAKSDRRSEVESGDPRGDSRSAFRDGTPSRLECKTSLILMRRSWPARLENNHEESLAMPEAGFGSG